MDGPLVELRDGRIHIAGDLTMHRALEIHPVLLESLEKGDALPNLDLSGVGEIDTAGLQILMSADREVLGRGGRLVIVAASQAVADVLALFRQEHLMESAQ